MTQIFVNIATTDLDRSKAFYTALGCDINPLFTDENAACVVWGDGIYFMVLTREFLSTFTSKPIADPREAVQTIIARTRRRGWWAGPRMRPSTSASTVTLNGMIMMV